MKMIEVKNGSKTTYRAVPDDYDPEKSTQLPENDAVQGDLTTSCRRLMSFSDIDAETWNRIFHPEKVRNSR